MSERQHEAAITREELEAILLHSGENALLVGGQALAIWAMRYDIEPTGELSKKVTSDADFIGTQAHARALGKALKWTVWIPTMDDGGAQTGKVTRLLPDGGVKQIDYLSGVVGLDTERIQSRAVELKLPTGSTIRVLHPLDVLESRLRNLQSLPSKRDAIGVAQARLAVAVARAFIGEQAATKSGTRSALSAIERIAKIALDKALVAVAIRYEIEPLEAVPVSRIKSTQFRSRRWPQILQQVAEARRVYAKRRLPLASR